MKPFHGVALMLMLMMLMMELTPVRGITPTLGVCYYPEQWNSNLWQSDLEAMAKAGIQYVRMAEFAWSIIEPSATSGYHFEVFDQVLDKMQQLGLKGILGTPTAAPPKWLIDLYPDILPVNNQGQTLHFGSRRQYSFSSPSYLNQTQRIVTAIAQHFGNHPAVVGWQIDNEYGCDNTIRSYDKYAAADFRVWLADRYDNNITQLNEAWGNVFWSMVYNSFDEIDLPFLTVAEPNPSASLDFYRFASDQVIRYNKLQVDIVRQYSPGRFITTNFMGFFFQFDTFKLGKDIDFASWDSYPLGFLDSPLGLGSIFTEEEKIRYAQTGHPDLASFHHDLYKAVGRGRFWIMEQQPGPVNWADNNPSPAAGVVRMWTWEAIAHGAEVVSYFRWREAPFAQEQYHSGLNRRDNVPDIGLAEASQVASELKRFPSNWSVPANQYRVALLLDFEAEWYISIERQGINFHYPTLVFNFYSTLRGLGLDVDIVPQGANLTQYSMVVIPTLPYVREDTLAALSAFKGPIIFGPRVGSKTKSFQIPENLPPSSGGTTDLQDTLLPIKIVRVESFREGFTKTVSWRSKKYNAIYWREWIQMPSSSSNADVAQSKASTKVSVTPVARYQDADQPDFDAAVVHGVSASRDSRGSGVHYISFWPEKDFIRDYLAHVCRESSIPILDNLRDDLRISRRGAHTFLFSYSPQRIRLRSSCNRDSNSFLVGAREIEPYGVAVWKSSDGEYCDGGETVNESDTSGGLPTLGIVVVVVVGTGTMLIALIFVGLRWRHLLLCFARRPFSNVSDSLMGDD